MFIYIYVYVDIGIFIFMMFVLIQFYNCMNFIKYIGLKLNYIQELDKMIDKYVYLYI